MKYTEEQSKAEKENRECGGSVCESVCGVFNFRRDVQGMSRGVGDI